MDGSLSGDAMGEVLEMLMAWIFCQSDLQIRHCRRAHRSLPLLSPAAGAALRPDGARRRIYVTTGRRSVLKALADTQGWETFHVPDDAGSRYSVLTAAGLLPIAVAGVDVRALLDGAAAMMEACTDPSFQCPAWRYAAIRYELYRSGRTIELLSCYDPAFRLMAQWWQALFAESEGKDGKGLFPVSAEFTADLHSIGQYLQEGRRLMFETVVRLGPSLKQYIVPAGTGGGDGLTFCPADPWTIFGTGPWKGPCWPTPRAACPTSSWTPAVAPPGIWAV